MTNVSTELYVHLVDNMPAPTEASTLDIKVELAPHTGVFTLTKRDASRSTSYDLTIADVTALGADANLDDAAADTLLGSLVLAINASSKRAIFSRHQHTHAFASVTRAPKPTASISESIGTQLGTTVRLEERLAVHLFHRCVATAGSMERRILDNFAEACATRDRTAAMRHYNSVLEMCVNLGRSPQLRGAGLDSEVASISGLHVTIVDDMRLIYNRTKHADENPTQRARYESAVERLPTLLLYAREVATKVLQATVLR